MSSAIERASSAFNTLSACEDEREREQLFEQLLDHFFPAKKLVETVEPVDVDRQHYNDVVGALMRREAEASVALDRGEGSTQHDKFHFVSSLALKKHPSIKSAMQRSFDLIDEWPGLTQLQIRKCVGHRATDVTAALAELERGGFVIGEQQGSSKRYLAGDDFGRASQKLPSLRPPRVGTMTENDCKDTATVYVDGSRRYNLRGVEAVQFATGDKLTRDAAYHRIQHARKLGYIASGENR